MGTKNLQKVTMPDKLLNSAFILLTIEFVVIIYAIQIFWSTKGATDFSGLSIILPMFALVILSLPTIIVSIIALKQNWTSLTWTKKLLICLGLVFNAIIICYLVLARAHEALYPPTIQMDPVSVLSSVYLV